MTPSLSQQRCLHHPEREAAYRCPGCKRYYCRECGAEHDGRILCAACLKKLTLAQQTEKRRWSRLAMAASPIAGLFIAWLFFFYLGQLLLSIPSSFHEGRLP